MRTLLLLASISVVGLTTGCAEPPTSRTPPGVSQQEWEAAWKNVSAETYFDVLGAWVDMETKRRGGL